MGNFKIPIYQNGKVTLKTAGKYCDRDIDVRVNVSSGTEDDMSGFWDAYQNNGERTDYNYAFAYSKGWDNNALKPKYDLTPGLADYMFAGSPFTGDLARHFDDLGIGFNLSGAFSTAYMFSGAFYITRLGTLDLSAVGQPTTDMFSGCFALETIDKLIMSEFVNLSFNSCSALKNITIEGTISANYQYFADSTELTHDSLMSIINALEAKTSGAWSITLGSENKAKLTTEELAIAQNKGWTVN